MIEDKPMPNAASVAGNPPATAETTPQAMAETGRPVLYRPNVAAILIDTEGRMFVAERAHIRGSWQFPQGGVDPGESLEEALFREVEEEIGVPPKLIQIRERKGGYRYEFPKGRLKYGVYGGQEQVYYLCKFLGTDSDINLDTKHREFGRHRWITPEKFDLEWVPRFKRDVYRKVFQDFFQIDK